MAGCAPASQDIVGIAHHVVFSCACVYNNDDCDLCACATIWPTTFLHWNETPRPPPPPLAAQFSRLGEKAPCLPACLPDWLSAWLALPFAYTCGLLKNPLPCNVATFYNLLRQYTRSFMGATLGTKSFFPPPAFLFLFLFLIMMSFNDLQSFDCIFVLYFINIVCWKKF